jgi:hypothetical protein
VNCQAIGSSERSIKYLAPYVFKVAISDSRIVKVKDRQVFFRYKKSLSERWRTMSLDVIEFLRRFLKHVLPGGFMKIRYYGFLSTTPSVPLNEICTLIELAYGFEVVIKEPKIESAPPIVCNHCGGWLKYRCSVLPFQLGPSRSG